ncbi:hypothetical protein MTO96_018978 [Rhipicephalus appendiculatus]
MATKRPLPSPSSSAGPSRGPLSSVPGFRDVRRRPPSSPPSQLLAVCTRNNVAERISSVFARRRPCSQLVRLHRRRPHFFNSAETSSRHDSDTALGVGDV